MFASIKSFLSEHTIAAAVIGLMGAIILALCGLLGVILTIVSNGWTGEAAAVELIIAATQTAEARTISSTPKPINTATSISIPTSTDSNNTSVEPTLNFTPLLIQTLTPTSTPRPASTWTPKTVILPTDTLIPSTLIPPTNTPPPNNTATPPNPTEVPTSDCWVTIWSFSPTDNNSISTQITQARDGYTSSFDSNISPPDGNGSLRLETTKVTNISDPNAFSWMENIQRSEAKDANYRVVAWLKTQNAYESHISILGRDSSGKDVYFNNGATNQIAKVPMFPSTGTTDWQYYSSREFNPVRKDNSISQLIIGINAGWSLDGNPSITWFDQVELQICQ